MKEEEREGVKERDRKKDGGEMEKKRERKGEDKKGEHFIYSELTEGQQVTW